MRTEHSAVASDTYRSNRRRLSVAATALVLTISTLAACTAPGSENADDVQRSVAVPTGKAAPAGQMAPAGPAAPTGSTGGQRDDAPEVTTPEVRDTHILYSSVPAGWATAQVFRMSADGTGSVQMTFDPSVEHNWPRPSPDGTKILYYKAAPGSTVNDVDTNNLWVMDSDGTGHRELIPDGAYGWTRQSHVEWSPDGTRLLMAAGDAATMDLFVTNPTGGAPVRVTNRGWRGAFDPSWTPDGRGALFVACPMDKQFTCFWWDNEVHRVDVATGVEQRLTYDGFADFDPYMSPDGSTIVWLRCNGLFPMGPWSIFRSSTSSTPLSPEAVVDDGHINANVDFSADGGTLLFSRAVIGGAPWQSAATVGVDGSGLSLVGGRPSSHLQTSVVYWP